MSITKLNNLSVSALTALPSGVGGKVLQVVTATDSTGRSTTSSSFVTASNTLSVSITPSSTSNKVFIIVHTTMYKNAGSATFALYKNASYINDFAFVGTGGIDPAIPLAFSYLDSPSTTSSTTYQLYFKSNGGTYPSVDIQSNNILGSITAFEIAG
jgi:hypothetical protein